jgi:tripartite-type tricarboxylate transporter receptor subunit TctC
MRKVVRSWVAAVASAALMPASLSQAQEWPARPVTVVVPFAAGGPLDTVGRIMAQALSDELGQQFVVENVGGAGGMIGASRVAKAEPDGYTMLVGSNTTFSLNQIIYKKPLVDGAKDFAHVAIFADSPRILLARKDLPVGSLKELVDYARGNAAKMQYGSAGVGSGSHVCAVLLDQVIGTKIAHVPYRGSAPAMQDVIAGRLDYIAEQISTATGLIAGGQVKGIALMGAVRSAALPQLLSSEEEGFKGLDCGAWSAIGFPKGTPPAIVQKLARTVDKVLDRPDVVARYDKIGVVVMP